MLLHIIYIISIVAQSMSGAIMGTRRLKGLFGLCMISTVAVLSGGTIRDVMLGRSVGWIVHPEYLLFTMGTALVNARVVQRLYLVHLRNIFLTVDNLGMVAFTVLGCDIAVAAGMSPVIIVMAGMITGVVGGVIRDLMCYIKPWVVRSGLYVTVSLFTGVLYVSLLWFKVDPNIAQLVSIGTGVLLRVLALNLRWQLPNFYVDSMNPKRN